MMRRSSARLHGPWRCDVGSGALTLGTELQAMMPSNRIYYDPAKLRWRLDEDGYIYLKNVVPREIVDRALLDVAGQMERCGWTRPADQDALVQQHGLAIGVPCPASAAADRGASLPPPVFALSDELRTAITGPNVMTVCRQVFGGTVQCIDQHLSLDFAPPDEAHGFRTESTTIGSGSKLSLVAWMPLHDTTLHNGGLCVVRGSNRDEAFAPICQTYGSYDYPTGDVRGDGCFTHDPRELLPLAARERIDEQTSRRTVVNDCPPVSTTFEAGDVVLMTVYTMHAFLTNRSPYWRISACSRWLMEGDDVGPDKRFVGASAPGLGAWLAHRDDAARFPRTVADARAAWGLPVPSSQ